MEALPSSRPLTDEIPDREASHVGTTELSQVSDRHCTELMIITTFATGIIDAIGYLGFDKIFTANMTGNVIVLGMGLSGSDELPVAGPLIALISFTLGAATAGLCLRKVRGGWTAPICAMFLAETVLLGLVGVLLMLAPPQIGSPAMHAFTFALAFLLGAQAAAARKVGVKDVTTVVVTSTITSLAAESWSANTTVAQTLRRIGAVAALSAGAVCGGLLHYYGADYGDAYGVLATACGIAVVTGLGAKRLRDLRR